ncbi:MAG: hypothetical protein ACLTZT_14135 [Butyricimonas faecalis]
MLFGVYVDVKNSDMTFVWFKPDRRTVGGANKYFNEYSRKSNFTDAMNRPLLVVDGFPTGLEMKNLNPNDVGQLLF